MKPLVPYKKSSITDLEAEYVRDAVINSWGDQCYAHIRHFEDIFKKHLSARCAIAIPSFTGRCTWVWLL